MWYSVVSICSYRESPDPARTILKPAYQISVDLSEILDAIESPITAQVLPTVHQAVRALASETAYRWKDAVAKAPLWQGDKAPYIASIQTRMEGDFTAVVETDFKDAGPIETGRPARDLKQMLDSSLKVRVVHAGKNAGKRYLVIPFRHAIPGPTASAQAMPVEIYQLAKTLAPSKVACNTFRLSGTGAYDRKTRQLITVPQKLYSWGGRLPAGLAPKMKANAKTDRYAGMVRFDTSTGGAKSSAYLTFRVMMEGSPGWVVKPKPGLYLAQGVAEEIERAAPAVFAAAFKFLDW